MRSKGTKVSPVLRRVAYDPLAIASHYCDAMSRTFPLLHSPR